MPAVSDVQGNCEYVYGHRMLGIQAFKSRLSHLESFRALKTLLKLSMIGYNSYIFR